MRMRQGEGAYRQFYGLGARERMLLGGRGRYAAGEDRRRGGKGGEC